MGRGQWRWGQKKPDPISSHNDGWGAGERGADSDDVLSGDVEGMEGMEGVRAGSSWQHEPRFHTDGKMEWDCRLSIVDRH